jgi:hypothetical protein
MPNPVAANDLSPISGSLQTSRISYGVETAGKNYGQNYNGTTWYSDIPQNGSQYTIISDNYTANYYVSRSNAEGAYVEGGLPAVDEYSAPVFWVTVGTSSLDVITIVNGLPDRIGQVPFNSGSQALNWIASSSNYFAVGPPYEQIDADQLALYLDALQVISYPTTASIWYDISGYNYKATLINGPTFNSSYGSITFDGSDDYGVFIGTGGDILSSASRVDRTATWEGIVRFNTSTGANAVITKWDNTSGENWWFGRYPSNTVHLALMTSAGYQGLYSSATIGSTTTQFQYIAATTSGSNYVFYINGVNAGSGTYSGTWNVPDLDTPVALGAQNTSTGGAALFGGDMSKVRLYNKTLSASDIAQNYYQGPIVTGSITGLYNAGNLVSYAPGTTTTYNLPSNIISGSLQNGVAFSPLNGGYWSFDGADDRILFEGSTTNAWILNSYDTWTVNAWVRTPSGSFGSAVNGGYYYGPILSNTSGGPIVSTFQINGGTIAYTHYNGSWVTEFGSIPINDGYWHMLTWVNEGNNISFYVDSIFDGTYDSSLSGLGYIDNIGSATGGYYLGNVASVQINKGKAFTSDEVLQQYNATK